MNIFGEPDRQIQTGRNRKGKYLKQNKKKTIIKEI